MGARLGRTVRFLIRQQGYTQGALAAAACLDQGLISRIANGLVEPGAPSCIALGRAFGVSPRWLMLESVDDQLTAAGFTVRPRKARRLAVAA